MLVSVKECKKQWSTCQFISGLGLKKAGILRSTEISASFPRLFFFGNKVTIALMPNPLVQANTAFRNFLEFYSGGWRRCWLNVLYSKWIYQQNSQSNHQEKTFYSKDDRHQSPPSDPRNCHEKWCSKDGAEMCLCFLKNGVDHRAEQEAWRRSDVIQVWDVDVPSECRPCLGDYFT